MIGTPYVGNTVVGITGSITIDGQSHYYSGTASIPSMNVQGLNLSLTNPNATLTTRLNTVNQFNPTYLESTNAKALKTVEANTGSINSQYGIIQSIS